MKQKLQILMVVLLAIVSLNSIYNTYAQTQRNPVLEYCTGTWCVYCPQGHEIIQNTILPNIPNAIIIGYHGPANGSDPFSYFPGNSIISSLGFSAYPTGIVDRVTGIISRSAWYSQMNTRNNTPATVAIDMNRSFNKSTREFSASIDFTALTNLSGQYKFNVILLESGMVWAQTGGTTNYVHHHVVRAMMNGALGEEVINGTWNQNDVITKTVNYTVPIPGGPGPDIVWDSCNVVVMVYKVASPLASAAEIQQAIETTLISPDYVASASAITPDIIGENNAQGEYSVVIRNIGLLNDTYNITCNLEGPTGWTGEFTTSNGTFPFGETDSVQVSSGDSAVVDLALSPNGISGSGAAILQYESKNDPGIVGSVTLRYVTTTGIDILVVDASGEGYGELVANSVENVFSGSSGIISRTAFNTSAFLDNFQMVAWSAGIALPVFHPDEVDLLQDYLDNGGKLFINGQDIGADIASGQSQFAQSFYNNYMHASFTGNGTSYLINGIAGDPITNGIQFVLNDVYTRSPDNIAPYDGNASSIFLYFNGPNVAGIKAAAGSYKVVYFGFGFEQITDTAIRDTLISRIINYNGVEPMVLPSAPVLVSPANSEVIDSSSILFVWQQSQPQVSKYSIELDTTDQFTSPFVNSDITDTTYLFTGLLGDKNYWWRVKALNSAGWGDYSEVRTFSTLFVSVGDDESQLPVKFSLEQNYPNPFNPSTRINYSLADEQLVSLVVYDMLGREVARLVNERQPAGEYELEFDAASLASGTYIYKLIAGDFVSVKKMTLLK